MQAPAASSGDAKSGCGKILLRSSGRAADPNAVGDALWMLLLSYLDASLPGRRLFLFNLCRSSTARAVVFSHW